MHGRTVIVIAGMATGIIAGMQSPFGSEVAVAALILAGMQTLLNTFERKRDTHQRSVALSTFTALFCVGLFLGIVRAQLVEEQYPYTCSPTCTFEARIVSSPETKDAYQTFIVSPLNAQKNDYDVQVRTSLYPTFQIGQNVLLTGKVKEPQFMFPHGNEKSFDYVSYLHTKNVGSEMLFPKIELLASDELSITEQLGAWKASLVDTLHAHVSSPANTLASGMLFGNSSMSKELVETFRVAGLSHIVVLSGFNIAIVIAFILFVLSFLPLAVRVCGAAVVATLFVLMVGGEASVVRATLMSFVGLLAMILGREYVARQALMLSFAAIIMYDPPSLLSSASLHLSFLATAGIIYWSEPITRIIESFVGNKFLRELFVTTFAAYVATLPYVMHAFGTASLYALVANILVVPLVPIAMLMSFLVLLFAYVSSGVATIIGYVDSLTIDFILLTATTITGLPFAAVHVSASLIVMVLMYIFFAIFIWYFSRMKKDETPHTTKEGYLTDVMRY